MNPLSFLGVVACLLAGSSFVAGQSLPFRYLGELDAMANQVADNEHLTCNVKVVHSDPDDTRPVVLTLKTPEKTEKVEVGVDGEVFVPDVPEELWDESTVSHNLEKGAMTLELELNFRKKEIGLVDGSLESMLGAFKGSIADNLEAPVLMLATIEPGIKGQVLAVKGLTLESKGGGKGKISLMKGDEEVDSLDLSKKGEVTWLFEKYKPSEHSLKGTQGSKADMRFLQVMDSRDKLPANCIELLAIE